MFLVSSIYLRSMKIPNREFSHQPYKATSVVTSHGQLDHFTCICRSNMCGCGYICHMMQARTIFADSHHFSRTLGDVWWDSHHFSRTLGDVWWQSLQKHHHKNTTKTPPKHHHTTTKTPPQKHHHKNTITKNTITKNTTTQPTQKHHHKNTTKTPPHNHTAITSVELWAMFDDNLCRNTITSVELWAMFDDNLCRQPSLQ